MGERGAIPSGEDQGHRTKAEIEAQSVYMRPVVIDHPEPLATWSLTTREAWAVFWDSFVATAVETVDLPSLIRYFDLVDRQERMWEIVDTETGGTYTVPTEKSGDKAHPLLGTIVQLDGMIDRLERQFGIRPMSRARLGLKNLAAKAAGQKVAQGQAKRGRVVDRGPAVIDTTATETGP